VPVRQEAPGDRVVLVDPSLFTAPYDACLSDGLASAGLDPLWVTRDLRPGEGDDLRGRSVRRLFYPFSDGANRARGQRWRQLKGAEHLIGLVRLLGIVRRCRPLVVHVQWGLIPRADRMAIERMRATCPVVVTVHDVEPFNGKDVSSAQRSGFTAMLAAADRLIVHTARGREALIESGLKADRIAVIPHGPLPVPASDSHPTARADRRWTIVQFGKIQAYKGVDLLVEALGRLPADARARLRVIVAGEPQIDAEPLRRRAAALGLDDVIEWRLAYLDDAAIGDLLREADAFVFPYRTIEASGAFLMIAGLGKWIVASDLGAFSEAIGHGGDAGALVAPGDIDALAAALAGSIDRRPTRSLGDAIPDWPVIGRMTADVYDQARRAWRAERAKP
jgi:glycosyltransferase involved in cell wall biosynthesis